jgi:hypothetical protein
MPPANGFIVSRRAALNYNVSNQARLDLGLLRKRNHGKTTSRGGRLRLAATASFAIVLVGDSVVSGRYRLLPLVAGSLDPPKPLIAPSQPETICRN